MNPQPQYAPGWYNGVYWDGYQWVTTPQYPQYTPQYLYTPEGVAYYYGMDGLTYYADGTPCYPVASGLIDGVAPRQGAPGNPDHERKTDNGNSGDGNNNDDNNNNNNYSGGGGQEGGGGGKGAAEGASESRAHEDGRVVGVPVHGNMTTMNLDNVMYKAITQSRAFQNTTASRDLGDICDEIAEKVTFLDPTLVNDKTHPSPAYCLMMRLHMARPTMSEIKSLFYSEDSVFIRGLAMLYMRYVTAPRELFALFKPLLGDKERFDPRGRLLGAKPVMITIGDWARILLTDKKNGAAVLPPIPIPVQKDFAERLRRWDEGDGSDDNNHKKDDHKRKKRSTDDDDDDDSSSSDSRRSRGSPKGKRRRSSDDDKEDDDKEEDRKRAKK